MSDLSIRMSLSILTLLLAAAERLYARGPAHIVRIAAIMQVLTKEQDPAAALDRIEQALYEPEHETEEIEKLRRDLGF